MFIFQIAGLFAFNTGQRDGFHVHRFKLTFLRRVYILIIIGIPANRYRCRLIHRGGNCAVRRWYCYLKRFILSRFVRRAQK